MEKIKKLNPKKILKDKVSFSDVIEKELEDKGVNFFSPDTNLNIDTDFLSLPKNITEVNNKALGEYLNAFTQQKVYMRTLMGFAETLCEESKREYLEVSSEEYRKLLNTKLSETSKDREVNSNERVKPIYEHYLDCKYKVRLLELNISSIEDIIFMISREVSRRSGDFKEENRDYNVNSRRI